MIFISSFFGALITYTLREKYLFNPIRASVLPTIVFFALISVLRVESYLLISAFYGGTFVGMTTSKHLNHYLLLIASILFSFIFYYLVPILGGLGGSLGISAFMSVIITILFCRVLKKVLKLKETEK